MATIQSFNPTKNTWSQIANKQAYTAMTAGNLNSTTLPTVYDPIYNKLVEQIAYTMYRELRILRNWDMIGRTAPPNEYPGILREIYMNQRKGMNFTMDNGTRPTNLNWYEIFEDEIQVRYHSVQFRWMYQYTLFDEELRRFSGGNGETIARLAEMKNMNMINARNMFMDAFKKKLVAMLANNASVKVTTSINIADDSLTQADAKKWLMFIKNILREMAFGSAMYNALGEYMQVPKSNLQMLIPASLYEHVMTTAFPETIDNTRFYDDILPSNLVLMDTLGENGVAAAASPTTALEPTFDARGMNLLNWDGTNFLTVDTEPNLQCVIMDVDCIGVEDNLNEVLFGPKDITKLATPVAAHYWTKGYITDMLPSVAISYEAPSEPEDGE